MHFLFSLAGKEKKQNTLKEIICSDEKGSSMVEVLVGFMILMVVLSMLTGMIHFSGRLIERSRDNITQVEHLKERLKKKGNTFNKKTGITLRFKEENNDNNLAKFSMEEKQLYEYKDTETGLTLYHIK